ncbi:MAG: HAD family hydrolase [Treponema sp.]|jgi:putative hydrolase of the HAD superfamily|nr:HAD family hydrolase [Treponema sp.]
MRSGYEGVAFDLDGTLYPNYRLNIRLFSFILKEWRLLSAFDKARKVIRKEQETALPQGDFYKYQADIISGIMNIPAKVLQEKIDVLMYKGWSSLFKNIKLFKNVKETLAALRKAGYKLGLLSDFPPETKLELLGISGIWDAALCSEYYCALKPHPRSFLELADAMRLPPKKILYVGNSRAYDIAGAAGAGMKTAWIKNAFFPGSGLKKPKPDFSFSNYRQLYDFMIN